MKLLFDFLPIILFFMLLVRYRCLAERWQWVTST